MASIVDLVARITADNRQFIAGLEQSQRRTERLTRSVEQNSNRMSTALRNVAAAAAGLAIGAGLKSSLQSLIDAADQFDKFTLKVGGSVERLQEYNHVAQLASITTNTFLMALQRQTRRISQAAIGTGEAVGALNELGLSAQALAQLAPEDQFQAIAEAMQDVASAADRTRLAQKLWDSQGVKLLQIVNQGTAAIKAQREEAQELGVVMSRETVTSLVSFADAMTRVDAAATSLKVAFAESGLIVVLEDFISLTTSAVVALGEFAKATGIVKDNIKDKLERDVKNLKEEIADLEKEIDNTEGAWWSFLTNVDLLKEKLEGLKQNLDLSERKLAAFNTRVEDGGNELVKVATLHGSFAESLILSAEGTVLLSQKMKEQEQAAKRLAEAQERLNKEREEALKLLSDLEARLSNIDPATQQYLETIEEIEKVSKVLNLTTEKTNSLLESARNKYDDALGPMRDYASITGQVGNGLDAVSQNLPASTKSIEQLGKELQNTEIKTQQFNTSIDQLGRDVQATFREMFHSLRTEGFGGFFDSILNSFGRMLDAMLAQFAASGLMSILNQGGGGGFSIPGLGGSGLDALNNFGIDLGFGRGADFVGPLQSPGFTTATLGSVLGAAGLGFTGGGILNSLTGGNETFGSIGGGLGAGAGMIFGGPIGAVAGGVLGSIFGGLFGNNTPPNQSTSGRITAAGITTEAVDAETMPVFKELAGNVQGLIQSIELMAELPDNIEVAIDAGVRDGIQTGIVDLFTAGPQPLATFDENDTEGAFQHLLDLLLPHFEGLGEEALALISAFEGAAEETIAFIQRLAQIKNNLPVLRTALGEQSLSTFMDASEEVGGVERLNQLTSRVIDRLGLGEKVAEKQIEVMQVNVSEALSELGTDAENFSKDLEAALGSDLTGPMLAAWLEAAEALGQLEAAEKALTDARENAEKAAKDQEKRAREERQALVTARQDFEAGISVSLIEDTVERQVAEQGLAFQAKWKRIFDRANELGADITLAYRAYEKDLARHNAEVKKIREAGKGAAESAEKLAEEEERRARQARQQVAIARAVANSEKRNADQAKQIAEVFASLGKSLAGTSDEAFSQIKQLKLEQDERKKLFEKLRANFGQRLRLEKLHAEQQEQMLARLRDGLNENIEQIRKPIDDFIQSTKFGAGSFRDPMQQLQNAQAAFMDTVQQFRMGDATSQELTGVAGELRTLSRQAFASGPMFQQREQFIINTLENALSGRIEEEKSKFQKQQDALKTIAVEVNTGNAAIVEQLQQVNGNLNELQKARIEQRRRRVA